MIDELKEHISHKKKQNSALIGAVNQLTDEAKKTKEDEAEQLRKAKRARIDKQELYRDLSTYEYNFVRLNDFSLMSKLEKITQRIAETTKELDAGKKNPWIDVKQTDELLG